MKTGEMLQLPTFLPHPQSDQENRSSEETTSGILPELSVEIGDESLIFADRVWSAVEQAAAATADSVRRTRNVPRQRRAASRERDRLQ
jgi:hypothetical protein